VQLFCHIFCHSSSTKYIDIQSASRQVLRPRSKNVTGANPAAGDLPREDRCRHRFITPKAALWFCFISSWCRNEFKPQPNRLDYQRGWNSPGSVADIGTAARNTSGGASEALFAECGGFRGTTIVRMNRYTEVGVGRGHFIRPDPARQTRH
jgi:hypothetical protein